MKVPKMYKSSDRYNAGTDVIYNDESKLQYAPFIYAATESGDNGGDDGDGDDEEVEDTMVVHNVNGVLDKTASDIWEAITSDKIVAIAQPPIEGFRASTIAYITRFAVNDRDGSVSIYAMSATYDGDVGEFVFDRWTASALSGYPTYVDEDENT